MLWGAGRRLRHLRHVLRLEPRVEKGRHLGLAVLARLLSSSCTSPLRSASTELVPRYSQRQGSSTLRRAAPGKDWLPRRHGAEHRVRLRAAFIAFAIGAYPEPVRAFHSHTGNRRIRPTSSLPVPNIYGVQAGISFELWLYYRDRRYRAALVCRAALPEFEWKT